MKSAEYYALDYWELLVNFAFSKPAFIVIFVIIGLAVVVVALFLWLIVRVTTHLQRPPLLRFWGFFSLIAPPAISGTVLGLMPAVLALFGAFMLLKGYFFINMEKKGTWALDNYKLHWQDSQLDPNQVDGGRQGRMGFCFFIIGVLSISGGTSIFVPERESKREKEIAIKRTKDATKVDIWNPLLWRRNNMMYTSIIMGCFCIILLEFSFWVHFGNNIWTVLILFKLMDQIIDLFLDSQLNEELLKVPIAAAYCMTQCIMTLGTNDFLDFIFTYMVNYSFSFLSRLYIDPYFKKVVGWLRDVIGKFLDQALLLLPKWLIYKKPVPKAEEAAIDPTAGKKRTVQGVAKGETETVEPILGMLSCYSGRTLVALNFPVMIMIFMVFRDDTGMPELYTIRRQDMEYYLLFTVIIIFFQICADIFVHGALENFHGWKIYDYLIYTRYRFLQRETRWKGMEDTLDECINDSMRSLDQMCFSSQYYFMLSLYMNGLMLVVLGMEMMIRNDYGMWSDPVMLILLIFILCVAYLSENILKILSVWVSSTHLIIYEHGIVEVILIVSFLYAIAGAVVEDQA